MYCILIYDIEMNECGARISRNIFKICKKYMTHIQKSVFEGELTELQYLRLNAELSKYIRKDKDSVIMFKSRNERWLDKEFWGLEDSNMSSFI
ncbi:MAG: CRISPR-associated endonuclease Cas2 [Eubacterium sp.]|nr:CRISPR-associated endonuclease Cas2 [Gallibacter sp.]MDY6038197.1 CRISPR-associated endonuclease Cas2 [Eubacterium sp.]